MTTERREFNSEPKGKVIRMVAEAIHDDPEKDVDEFVEELKELGHRIVSVDHSTRRVRIEHLIDPRYLPQLQEAGLES